MRPAALALLVALALSGCGGSAATTASTAGGSSSPRQRGPAFGLTEDNAGLLWPQSADSSTAGATTLESTRAKLSALHPRYVRLLVDWDALQPDPGRAPALSRSVDGCARGVGPCVAYAGLHDELRAIAAQQRLARAQHRVQPEVVLDVFGTPAWAARAAGGCEPAETRAFSRPISPAGLSGYEALIDSLLALGSREGVALRWWAPWNEPNDPVFVSPQRASCAADAPTLAPAVYAELAQTMADELAAAGGVHHLLLGELNAFASDSPHRTSVSSFIAALPQSIVCLSETWSIHAYAARYRAVPKPEPEPEPVAELERSLDARGECGRRASIWVTEAGAGAPHPGRPRSVGAADEHQGCLRLARQLQGWVADARVRAIFQYSFREDPAFPVGLVSADLSHVYPAYRLWLLYARASAQGLTPPPQTALCP